MIIMCMTPVLIIDTDVLRRVLRSIGRYTIDRTDIVVIMAVLAFAKRSPTAQK